MYAIRKWLSERREKDRIYKQFAVDNQNEIDEYNEKTLSTLLLLGWVLTLLPLAAVPFSETKANAVPAYLVTFLSLVN